MLQLAPTKVKLTHGAQEIELSEARSRLTLGRDVTNDIVIADRKASRMHAHIERRREKFRAYRPQLQRHLGDDRGQATKSPCAARSWSCAGAATSASAMHTPMTRPEVLAFACLD